MVTDGAALLVVPGVGDVVGQVVEIDLGAQQEVSDSEHLHSLW